MWDQRRKTGVYGGNFNAVHNGHLQLARAAMEELQLEEVWFLPASIQPFKQELHIPDVRCRAAMIELAIQGIPHFSLCDYEMNKPGVSYTYETMQYLTKAYPDRKFYFLMGEDSARSFLSWRHPEIICACASLAIAPREDASRIREEADRIAALPKAEVVILHAPLYDISSTEIRRRHRDTGFCSRHLCPEVRRYMEEHHLYDGEEDMG